MLAAAATPSRASLLVASEHRLGALPAQRTTELVAAVVGLGYVGLPTALALHSAGFDTIGIDVSLSRLDEIRDGEPDILDSDRDLLRLARHDPQRFQVSQDSSAVQAADLVIICVPTPVDERQLPDLAPLRSACDDVVKNARSGQTIILTSTSYVGCTRDLLARPLEARGFEVGAELCVAFAPERIDPANRTFAMTNVPRIVGGITTACTASASAHLAELTNRVVEVSCPEAAELAKLLENTFRAVNIALANEIADIAATLCLDPVEVIEAASTKPFGFMAFHPGPGVGGHCIPCDPHYLLWQLRRQRVYPPLITAAMEGIATRPARVVERAAEILGFHGRALCGARVLVVGIAYKPDVADTRGSPALDVVADLRRRGASVAVHDPLVPSIAIDGESYISEREVRGEDYDLVIVTTLHKGMSTSSVAKAPLILDASYRLPSGANRFVP